MDRLKREWNIKCFSCELKGWLFLFCLLESLSLHAATLQPMQGVANNTAGRVVQVHPDPQVYRQILDMAFPSNLGKGRTNMFSLVLRFLPSFQPESQIVIRYDGNNNASLEYMVATVQLNAVLSRYFANTRTPDIAKAARLMDVKQAPLVISDEIVRSWFHELWTALSASTELLEKRGLAREIQADGTQYILHYQEGVNHLTFEYGGSELNNEATTNQYDLPLVKWMMKIRKEVAKLAGRLGSGGRNGAN